MCTVIYAPIVVKVADMKSDTSNVMQMQGFKGISSGTSCISAINFDGSVIYLAYYMMECIIPCA